MCSVSDHNITLTIKKGNVMTIFDRGNQTAAEYVRQGQTAVQDGWFQVERNYSASVQSCRDFNLKMVHALRSHADATLDLAEELAMSKTPTDVVGAWSNFVERQASTFQKQAGELVEIAQKGANENLQAVDDAAKRAAKSA
jgi:hypothetical protein